MAPSEAVEADIREKAAKLDRFYDRIMACRVIVEAPHRHHRKGKAYHIRIDITVPGGEIVVGRQAKPVPDPDARFEAGRRLYEAHEMSKYAAHDDVYVAIRDAFKAARRKLQDYARRQRGQVKTHGALPVGRVVKLFPEQGFGFLEAPDGREIYFHRNSVLEPGFDRLEAGAIVYFAEEPGEKGPQASTVRLAGKRSGAVPQSRESSRVR